MTTLRNAGHRVLRLLGNLAIALVMLGCAAFIVPTLAGYERYVITGGSMSGTFEVGAVAFEKAVPVADLRVGDVITYLPPAESGVPNLVTHRIVSIRHPQGGTVYRTKGDANAAVDPWTFELHRPTQARLELTVPLVGHVFMWLADRDTRVAVIGGPAALVALYSLAEVVGVGRGRRRHDTVPAPENVPLPA
jgi:signal peptidase I